MSRELVSSAAARAGVAYHALWTTAIVVTAIAPAHAQNKPPAARAGWPCEGNIDPSYIRMAEATGGKVMPFHPSEVGGSAEDVIASGRHEETIFRISGDVVDGAHEFDIPIDSTVESAYFFVALQCLQSARLTRPSGEALQTTAPDVEYHEFRAIRLFVVRQPAPGPWKIVVAGRGFLSIIASAKTTLRLDGVTFVDEGRPITVNPPRDKLQRLEMRTSGNAVATGFRFISSAGETIQDLDLKLDPGDGDHRTYAGEATPPRADFRCAITGTDTKGYPFQRVQPRLVVELR